MCMCASNRVHLSLHRTPVHCPQAEVERMRSGEKVTPSHPCTPPPHIRPLSPLTSLHSPPHIRPYSDLGREAEPVCSVGECSDAAKGRCVRSEHHWAR